MLLKIGRRSKKDASLYATRKGLCSGLQPRFTALSSVCKSILPPNGDYNLLEGRGRGDLSVASLFVLLRTSTFL